MDINKVLNEDEMKMLNEKTLPEYINNQFVILKELEARVNDAVQKANAAKEKANDAKGRAEKAKVEVGFRKTKPKIAFGLLQEALDKGAEMQMDIVDIQIDLADIQTISLEHQRKLAEITERLFWFGMGSIAMNRIAVKEIALRLKQASEEELSDLARNELENVLERLKAQENVLLTQQDIKEKLNNTKEIADNTSDRLKGVESRLEDKEKTDSKQNDKIEKIVEKVTEKEKEIQKLSDQNKEKDKEFSDFKKQSEEDDNTLFEFIQDNNTKILELDDKIENNNEHTISSLKVLREKINILENVVSKRSWKFVITGLVSISILIDILQILDIL